MLCSCIVFNLIYFIAVRLVCFGWSETSSTLLAGPKLIHYLRVLFAHYYKNIFVWSETFVLLGIAVESLFCSVSWFVFVTKYFYPKFFIVSSARGKCLPFKGSTIRICSCSILSFGGNIHAISVLLLGKVFEAVISNLNLTISLRQLLQLAPITWKFQICLHTWIFEALSSYLSTINFEDVRRPQSKFQSLDGGAHSLVVKHNVMFLYRI